MLIRYEFDLEQWQVSELFYPIRTKSDVIKILMQSTLIMLINKPSVKRSELKSRIILYINDEVKISRLLFFSEQKYFSIHFPFEVDNSDDNINFSINYETSFDKEAEVRINITNTVISDIMSIISQDIFILAEIKNPIFQLADLIYSDEIMSDYNFIDFLLTKLIFLEDGYIRYDHDKKNYKPEKPQQHPINHLDIFYSENATFKIGLSKKISHDEMINLLNLEEDCYFLNLQKNKA